MITEEQLFAHGFKRYAPIHGEYNTDLYCKWVEDGEGRRSFMFEVYRWAFPNANIQFSVEARFWRPNEKGFYTLQYHAHDDAKLDAAMVFFQLAYVQLGFLPDPSNSERSPTDPIVP